LLEAPLVAGPRLIEEILVNSERRIIPPKPKANRRVEGRTCGSCTACCFILGVPEVPTACYEPCPNCRTKKRGRRGNKKAGCVIYEERPPLCVAYECLWLQGGLRNQDRPDRLGVMFDTLIRQDDDLPALCARATVPGFLPKRAKAVIEDYANRVIIVVIDGAATARHVLGPQEMVEEFLRRSQEQASPGPDTAPGEVLLRRTRGV